MKGVEASVQITPLLTGPNDFRIQFNQDADIKSVRVKFNSSGSTITVEYQAFPIEKGLFMLTGDYFHSAGLMNMVVEATKSNGETISYPFKVKIPGVMPDLNG